MGRFTAFLTSCFDLAALLALNYQHISLFGEIQTSETGGQPYSVTFPFKVKYSLLIHYLRLSKHALNDNSSSQLLCSTPID